MSTIRVWKKKSSIGEPEKMRKIVLALGLRKFGKVKELKDTNCIRGMINKVKHLVSFELVK